MMKKRPFVIVEGPDGTGKTNLVERLIHDVKDVWAIHCGVPTIHPMIEYAGKMAEAAATDRPVVADRFHLGNVVYGPIVRGQDEIGKYGQLTIERLASLLFSPLIVISLTSWETCRDNWRRNRGREYVVDERTFRKIYDAYVDLETSLTYLRYDYESPEAENVIETVVGFLS